MKLVTVEEMQAIEREANARGWTYAQMMEKAGQGLAEIVQSFYGYEESSVALGLAGSGNNGGDTLIALTELAHEGWEVKAYLVKDRPEGDPLVARLVEAGGEVARIEADDDFEILDKWVFSSAVLIDGVFGTGIRLPLRGRATEALARVKDSTFRPPVVAVDCPSGVDLNTGEVASETLPADVTVCMAAVKVGLLKFPAFALAGEIQQVDIGLPEGLPAWDTIVREVINDEWAREVLPPRLADSHKGTYGTVQVVAGSVSYTGAALLAAKAALKTGAGLVQVGVPAALHAALAGQIPEATWVLLPSENGVIAESAVDALAGKLERATVLLFGPGFGVEDPTAGFVRRLLEDRAGRARRGPIGFIAQPGGGEKGDLALPPMVIDADGLKLMARVPEWWKRLPSTAVLTPHPGEMAILTSMSVKEIQADRMATAERHARDWGHVVVLKGALTVIASPDGRTGVIPVATSALAHAGTGDVLAGIIASLRGQGIEAYEAAAAGAWLHAQAGILAAERVGHEAAVSASDLIASLPDVMSWVW